MMGRKLAQTAISYGLTLDRLVPENHYVRALDAAFDWSFVRKLAAKKYSHLGQPSVDPVVLVKMAVLGYWEGVRSERQMCRTAEVNVAWRWFLNYEFEEPIFNHSVLTKFRRRMGQEFFRECLAEVVRACCERGLVRGHTLYVDATLTDADASLDSTRSRALLEQLRKDDVDEYVAALHVVNDEKDDDERPSGPTPPREKRARGRGLKASGKPPASERIANRMMSSRTDGDAELFRKEGEPIRLCHKAHFAVDSGPAKIITAVVPTAATEHDSHDLPAVIAEHERNVGRTPTTLVADKGYSAKAAYRDLDERGIEALIPPKRYANSQGGEVREAFTFDAERNSYWCPSGHELKEFSVAYPRHCTEYRPAPRTCVNCPQKPVCAPGKGDRSVHRHWNQSLVDAAAERLATRRGRRLYRRRMHICEAPNAELKVQGTLRRARFRGRTSTAIQQFGEAMTYNLKRLSRPARYLVEEPAAGLTAATNVLTSHVTRIAQLGPLSLRLPLAHAGASILAFS